MTNFKKINIYDDNDKDNDSLLLNNINKSKINLNIICIYTFLVIIITLQAITLNYFIMVGNILEQFDDININDINIYINKTKTIIDYVCVNLIKC